MSGPSRPGTSSDDQCPGEIRRLGPSGGHTLVETRRVCTLKYSYDGRIGDGWYCARFVSRVKELLEHPEELVGAEWRAPGQSGEAPADRLRRGELGEGVTLGAAHA